MDDRNCNGVDPDLFFATDQNSRTKQRKLCHGDAAKGQPDCPVRQQCLAYTMATEPSGTRRFGYAGGKTGLERERLAELLKKLTTKEESND